MATLPTSMKTKTRFYFTWGDSNSGVFPHCGGWTEITISRSFAASSGATSARVTHGASLGTPYLSSRELRAIAIEIFRMVHPDQPGHEGIVNCAGIYDEDTFAKTRMAQTPEGNFGKRCVERITFELEELE